MPVEPGSRLGSYEILGPLGAGGMGEVWLARDTRLQREVALKILTTGFTEGAQGLARFTREAHVLASLNHPGIGTIYTFEEIDGLHFLGLELVPGDTLKQRISRGPIPVAEALGIARQIADALEAAHEKGILHRDLKPANVKVTPDGRVKLLDFGLAKAFAADHPLPELSLSPTTGADHTRQGLILGTASYMSPEQARGQPLDARSDLWSLGCVLYEMLAGRKAFDGETLSDILVAIIDREPDWNALPASTPPPVRDLLQGLLEKRVDHRWRDVRDVKAALASAFETHTTIRTHARARGPVDLRPLRWAVAAAGAVAAALLAALLLRTHTGDGALPKEKYLAIMPATDLTGRDDGRQLCDGLSFSLGVKLQSFPNLAIMRPSSPAMLKETDVAKWARDTGANLLVQPAVRQLGDTRQISFSISVAGSPVQIAAGEVTGPAGELFRLEDELTQKMVAALKIHLATGAPVPTPAPANVPTGAAQTDYVVALGHLEHYNDNASVEKAISLLARIPGGEGSAPVQAALGRAYLSSYNLTKDVALAGLAQQAARRASTLDPDLPEAQVTLGLVLTAAGQSAEAAAVIQKALARDPRSVPALLALETALEKSKDAAGAEKAALRIVELRPTSWTGFNRLGILYFGISRYEKAAESLRRAIALNPLDPDAAPIHLNLGAVLLRMGRFEEARAALDDSIRIRPTPQGYSNLGVAHYLLGRFPDAAASFQRAVDLAPKDHRWHIYLGDALSQIPGQADRARAAYEAALPLVTAELSMDPADAVNVVLLGRCLARTGAPEKAWSEIQRGVSLAPEDEDVLETAAAAAMVLGKKPEALAWLKKAVAHGYGLVEIQHDPDFVALRGEPDFGKLAAAAPPSTNQSSSTGVKK